MPGWSRSTNGALRIVIAIVAGFSIWAFSDGFVLAWNTLAAPKEAHLADIGFDGEKKERGMIGVFVTFRYGSNFDEEAVRKIAETARARFEGMPGLRSKAFTVNSGKREAVNYRCACGAHNGSLRRTPQRRVRADCDASGER
jgi:hypothetical protein